MSWQTLLAIGSGGFLGAILRAYLTILFNNYFPHPIALGTLLVNLLGSFIMGGLFSLIYFGDIIPIHVKSFISTGLLGAMTTFSTFALESMLLLQGGLIFLAFLNIILNAIGSVIFCFLGFYLIRYFFL